MPVATRSRSRLAMPAGFNPLRMIELASGFRDEVPSVIEFATSDRYLNRPYLYPRQATLLKTIFLQQELFTQYDYDVLGMWAESYRLSADEHGEGNNGIQSDIFDRIEINRRCPCGHDRGYHGWPDGGCTHVDNMNQGGARCLCQTYKGRPWFRQVANISGRRGGKGHIGGYAGSYVLWNYLAFGDPQEHFGVDRDKRMTSIVFAGKKEQARANQWKDLVNIILGGPCFSDYVASPLGETLLMYAPHDFERMYDRHLRGVGGRPEDIATFEIVPKESTLMAARGPASFMQHYDEMAHVVATGANRSAEEVWTSATPSLDQFGDWAFIYIPTSPWQKLGQAYVEYQQSIEKNPDNTPAYPEKMMVQLTSWDIYEDWEIANDLLMEPEGIRFQPLKGAIQAYDHGMKQLERANPDTFKVERRSLWAVAMDAYLNTQRVKEMWRPWPTEHDVLVPQERGRLDLTYRAHGDPSKSGAGFGFAIGHIAGKDERGLPHVVFDVIHSWQPQDYTDSEIDYAAVENDLYRYAVNFMPSELTFDQFNSVATIQSLRTRLAGTQIPKRVVVDERTATAPLNWKTYETFKTALNMGLVHGPYHELADLELTFLQEKNGKVDHPTTGPVQTKDVADCIAIVVYELIGDQMAAFVGDQLSNLTLGASAPGGMNPYTAQTDPIEQLSGMTRGGRPGGGSFNPSRRGRFGRG